MIHKLIFCFSFVLLLQSGYSQGTNEPVSPCVSEIVVPNSFRGNGDGVNDYFKPIISGTPETYEMTIFNRWGIEIFKTQKLDEGWNGSYKGTGAPAGTYYWVIKHTCAGSKEAYSATGFIIINR